MLNGLDLFSGIGGLSLALQPWTRVVAYCEVERYAQAVLLSRMQTGELEVAPIWDDVRTISGEMLPKIDIIFGGFPCQDLSAAGAGRGLAGERSGLYWQIERLVRETNPRFVFLENVPAIRTRGLNAVVQSLTELGYDCRWTIVSAAEVGAPHLRKRWFLLANSRSEFLRDESRGSGGTNRQSASVARNDGAEKSLANANGRRRDENAIQGDGGRENEAIQENGENDWRDEAACERGPYLADTNGKRLSHAADKSSEARSENKTIVGACPAISSRAIRGNSWWAIEPDVGRVAHGVPQRVDRLRGLGNAVVPLQAREAFMRLMELEALLKEGSDD